MYFVDCMVVVVNMVIGELVVDVEFDFGLLCVWVCEIVKVLGLIGVC